MNLIHYNILDGCQGAPDRFARLGAWLAAQAADLVTLNEVNGWDTASLAPYAAAWGYPHVHVTAMSSRYRLAILARQPFSVVAEVAEGFHHGVLVAQAGPLHLLVTHLCPVNAARRQAEAELLAARLATAPRPLLLLGDLNTLSPLDAPWYDQAGTTALLAHNPHLRRKFLDEHEQPDYRPMATLLAAGLVDYGARQQPRHSIPTPVNQDANHAAELRLDYILAAGDFGPRPPRVTVVHGPEVDRLSDHYPVRFDG
jgi:endonuclease/exonuclease/phosphatase family metal-dependent hydrolase